MYFLQFGDILIFNVHELTFSFYQKLSIVNDNEILNSLPPPRRQNMFLCVDIHTSYGPIGLPAIPVSR
jgi:hypothetical protein